MWRRAFPKRLVAALVLALGLGACGGPEAGVPAEPLETVAAEAVAAPCAGTSAYVSISTATVSGTTLSASGGWAVSGGANGVRLEYWIDGVKRQEEDRAGTSGGWSMTEGNIGCGSHSLVVKVYPRFSDATSSAVCLSNGYETGTYFTRSCAPTASLSCSYSEPVFSCTGSGSGGVAPLRPQWRYSDRAYGTSTWRVFPWQDSTSWTYNPLCKPWPGGYYTRVEFRVVDANGVLSPVQVQYCALE